MDPLVTAAIVGGIFGLVTLAGTVLVQIYCIRRKAKDTEDTLGRQFTEQRDQLYKTLAAQLTDTSAR